MKRGSLLKSFFIVLFVGFILISCDTNKLGLKTYKLTLGENIEIVSPKDLDKNKVDEKTEIIVKVNTPENKELASFKVNDKTKTLKNSLFTFKIDKDTNITATFKNLLQLTLSENIRVVSPNNLDLNSIQEGTNITVEVITPENKEFRRFTFNGEEKTLDVNNQYKFKITENTSIVAEFIDLYTLTLSEGVSIISPSDLDLNSILSGTEITVEVTIPENQELDDFRVNGEVKNLDENNQYQFEIIENSSLVAEFIDLYTLTLGEEVSIISPSDLDLNSILSGTEITVEVSIQENQELNDFRVNGEVKNLDGNNQYQFEITENTTINANIVNSDGFYSLTLSEGAAVTHPSNLNLKTIASGTGMIVQVTVPEDKILDRFTVNGVEKSLDDNDRYIFAISEDTDIVVTFITTCSLILSSYIRVISPTGLDLGKVVENTEVLLKIKINNLKAVEDLKDNYNPLNLDLDSFNYKLENGKIFVEKEFVVDKSYHLSVKYSDNLKIPPVFQYEAISGGIKLKRGDYSGDILIPNFVTSIGKGAFSGCNNLSSIDIPNSVTSIGAGAFGGCSSLSSIDIPDSVTSIGDYTFNGCSSLSSIDIPDGVTSIGASAFKSCSSLSSINIPDGVNSIGNGAFYECSSLSSVTIGDGVTSIGNSAFYECSSLSSVTIGDGVTSIGNSAFYGCSSLSSVTIGDGVTSIENSAFYGCSGLSSIEIPDSVTSIGDCVFYGCSSLSSVNIPNSVTSIGYSVFRGCSSLSSVNIPDGVTSIGYSVFRGCSSLSSINIPDSVTSLGNGAFLGCSSLSSIDIPDSVTSIGRGAFFDCYSLTSVDIPDSVTSIGVNTFYCCRSLSSVNIPDSVTSIQVHAFWKTPFLEIITALGNGFAIVNNILFYIDDSLVDVDIPNGVTRVEEYVFKGNDTIRSVVFPDSVISSIGDEAFKGCSSLSSVIIGSGITSIGDYTFGLLSSLSSVIIGDGVTSIGSYAFSDCSSLSSVNIPDSVTSIGVGAFGFCNNLHNIYIPISVNDMGANVFKWCSSLTINCERYYKPSGWNNDWNPDYRPVNWGVSR